MRRVGIYELKTHLSGILDAVEHGESVVVTRHGKLIARILPPETARRQDVREAVRGLLAFPRKPLPNGVTMKELIRPAGRE